MINASRIYLLSALREAADETQRPAFLYHLFGSVDKVKYQFVLSLSTYYMRLIKE